MKTQGNKLYIAALQLKRSISKAIVIVLVLLTCNNNASSQSWPLVPGANVSVTNQAAVADVNNYWAAPDGIGGCFSVWEDDRNDPGGKTGIFCQRIRANSSRVFVSTGITIADQIATSNQKRPFIAQGSSSSALIVWEDERNAGTTSDDIYAAAIDSAGAFLWGSAGGVVVCNAAGKQERPQIISDGSGGAIIVWRDKRAGNRDLYAQRLNASGAKLWTPANGVVISAAPGDQTKFHLIPDGSGGAIVVWEDDRYGTTIDIFAQNINSAGNLLWGTPVDTCYKVCINTAGDQKKPQAISDGAGGAIFTWEDKRTGTEDIYAARITNAGILATGWVIDGTAICSEATAKQKSPMIVADNAGGAFIAWEDERNKAALGVDLYLQRVSSDGVPCTTNDWVANGIVVCNNNKDQKNPHMSTAQGGAYVLLAWDDDRNNPGVSEDVYLEAVNLTGTLQSGVLNGIQITNDANVQKNPFIFDNGNKEWIIIWEDERNNPGNTRDLFVQGINSTVVPALATVLPIELLSFEVVLNKNRVELKWITSSEKNNAYFTIERSVDGINFEEVIQAEGAGTTNQQIEYFDIDYNPMEGITFYRLKQTDYNGKTTLSKLVPLEYLVGKSQESSFDKEPSSIKIWPNSNDGSHINIEMKGYDAEQEVLVVVRDITGREFYSKVLITDINGQIVSAIDPYNKLPQGTYLVIGTDKNHLLSNELIVR